MSKKRSLGGSKGLFCSGIVCSVPEKNLLSMNVAEKLSFFKQKVMT